MNTTNTTKIRRPAFAGLAARAAFAGAAALFAALLVNCGGAAYKDGEWQGKSGTDDRGAWGEVTVTIKQGKVAGCVFITRQKDGTIKAEDYGKVNGEISNADYYEKAQLAVRAMRRYAEQYAQTGKLEAVDVISGATIAYNQFMEAADKALAPAKRPPQSGRSGALPPPELPAAARRF